MLDRIRSRFAVLRAFSEAVQNKDIPTAPTIADLVFSRKVVADRINAAQRKVVKRAFRALQADRRVEDLRPVFRVQGNEIRFRPAVRQRVRSAVFDDFLRLSHEVGNAAEPVEVQQIVVVSLLRFERVISRFRRDRTEYDRSGFFRQQEEEGLLSRARGKLIRTVLRIQRIGADDRFAVRGRINRLAVRFEFHLRRRTVERRVFLFQRIFIVIEDVAFDASVELHRAVSREREHARPVDRAALFFLSFAAQDHHAAFAFFRRDEEFISAAADVRLRNVPLRKQIGVFFQRNRLARGIDDFSVAARRPARKTVNIGELFRERVLRLRRNGIPEQHRFRDFAVRRARIRGGIEMIRRRHPIAREINGKRLVFAEALRRNFALRIPFAFGFFAQRIMHGDAVSVSKRFPVPGFARRHVRISVTPVLPLQVLRYGIRRPIFRSQRKTFRRDHRFFVRRRGFRVPPAEFERFDRRGRHSAQRASQRLAHRDGARGARRLPVNPLDKRERRRGFFAAASYAESNDAGQHRRTNRRQRKPIAFFTRSIFHIPNSP